MTITKDIKNKAEQLFKKMPDVNKFFVNAKGEFFTREDLCKLSKEKYTAIGRTVKVEDGNLDINFKDVAGTLSKDDVIDQLKPMKRKDLDEKATQLGVTSVNEFSNKSSLIDAIVAVLFPEKKEAAEEGAAEEGAAEEGAAEEGAAEEGAAEEGTAEE